MRKRREGKQDGDTEGNREGRRAVGSERGRRCEDHVK